MFTLLKKFFLNLFREEKRIEEILKKHLEWDRLLIQRLFNKKQKFKIPNLRQLKYLPSFFNQEEKKLVIVILGIFVVSSILLGLRIYYHFPLKPDFGGEYTEGIIGQPSLNTPFIYLNQEADADLSKLIFSGLVRWENYQIVSDLAEKWQVSADGKTYLFHLRKNVFWHDGQKFTSEDVVFTLKTLQKNQVNNPLFSGLREIKIKKIDDYQIEISKEDPLNLLPILIFGLIPKHLWQNIDSMENSSQKEKLRFIGTGPFQFKSLTKNKDETIKKLILERNKKYYQSLSYLEKINLKFFNSLEEATQALLTKKIDGLSYLKKNKNNLILPPNLQEYNLNFPYYTAVFLNQKSKIVSSRTIRKVLALSIDKKKIAEELGEQKNIFDQVIACPLFNEPAIKRYNYNPKQAEEILTKAGWLKKEDRRIKKKHPAMAGLELNLIASDSPEYKKVAEKLKNYWTAIGIKINLEILAKDDFQKRVKTRKYDLLLYSILEGHNSDPFPLWHSSQIKDGLNLSNFENRKADILLEKGRLTTEQEERKKYYQEFQEIIMEEVGLIPLYQTNFYYLLDKKIKGFALKEIALPTDRWNEITKWYLKTKRGR